MEELGKKDETNLKEENTSFYLKASFSNQLDI